MPRPFSGTFTLLDWMVLPFISSVTVRVAAGAEKPVTVALMRTRLGSYMCCGAMTVSTAQLGCTLPIG